MKTPAWHSELTLGNFFQDSGVVPGRLSFSGDAGIAGGALPDEHARTDDHARTGDNVRTEDAARTFQQAGGVNEVLPADHAGTEDHARTDADGGALLTRNGAPL